MAIYLQPACFRSLGERFGYGSLPFWLYGQFTYFHFNLFIVLMVEEEKKSFGKKLAVSDISYSKCDVLSPRLALRPSTHSVRSVRCLRHPSTAFYVV